MHVKELRRPRGNTHRVNRKRVIARSSYPLQGWRNKGKITEAQTGGSGARIQTSEDEEQIRLVLEMWGETHKWNKLPRSRLEATAAGNAARTGSKEEGVKPFSLLLSSSLPLVPLVVKEKSALQSLTSTNPSGTRRLWSWEDTSTTRNLISLVNLSHLSAWVTEGAAGVVAEAQDFYSRNSNGKMRLIFIFYNLHDDFWVRSKIRQAMLKEKDNFLNSSTSS